MSEEDKILKLQAQLIDEIKYSQGLEKRISALEKDNQTTENNRKSLEDLFTQHGKEIKELSEKIDKIKENQSIDNFRIKKQKERIEKSESVLREYIESLECECDSYNGYTCPKHNWLLRLDNDPYGKEQLGTEDINERIALLNQQLENDIKNIDKDIKETEALIKYAKEETPELEDKKLRDGDVSILNPFPQYKFKNPEEKEEKKQTLCKKCGMKTAIKDGFCSSECFEEYQWKIKEEVGKQK